MPPVIKGDANQHFALAMAHEAKENYAEAIREYQRTLDIEPRHIRAVLHLGFLYAHLGDLDQCVQELQAAWELQHDIDALLNKDAEHKALYQRKVQTTLDALRRPLSSASENAPGHLRVGAACRYLGRTELALESLRNATTIDPKLREPYVLSGQLLTELGQHAPAISILKQGIEQSGEDAETRAHLGIAYDRQNMGGLALQSLQKAIELQPDGALYHLWLGRVFAHQDKHTQAIAEYHRALVLERGDPEVYFALAESCMAVYRPDLAIQMLREAVALNRYFTEAHFKLGLTYLQLGQADQAVTSFESALEFNPNDAYAHYHLAEAFERLTRLDQAVTHFVQAVTLNPQDSYAAFNLGRLLDRLGRPAEALAHLERATRLNPNDANLARTCEEVRARAGSATPAAPADEQVEAALAAAVAVAETIDETAAPPAAVKYTAARPTAYDAFESLDGPLLWDLEDEDEEAVEAVAAAAEAVAAAAAEAEAEAVAAAAAEAAQPQAELAEAAQPQAEDIGASPAAEPVAAYQAPVMTVEDVLIELDRMLSFSGGTLMGTLRSDEPGEEEAAPTPAPAASTEAVAETPEERLRRILREGEAARKATAPRPDEGARSRAEDVVQPTVPAPPSEEIPDFVDVPPSEEIPDFVDVPPSEEIPDFVDVPHAEEIPPFIDEVQASAAPSFETPMAVTETPTDTSTPLSDDAFGAADAAMPPTTTAMQAFANMGPSMMATRKPAAKRPSAATLGGRMGGRPAPPTMPLVTSGTPVAAVAPPKDDLLTRALAQMGQGHIDEARALLQQRLEEDDADYRALFFLAWTIRLLGDAPLARQFFTVGARVAEAAGDEGFARMYAAEVG